MDNVKILNFSAKGIEVGVGIIIKNPNFMNFSVYNSSFNIKLNDLFIGTATLKEKVKINGKSEELQAFTFQSYLSQLNMASLPKIFSIVQDKNVNVSVEGVLKVGNFFYTRNVPVSLQQRVSLSK